MFSLKSFKDEYEPQIAELAIRDRPYRLFVPGSLDKFINPEDVFQNFPLWSKLWEASLVLADFIAGKGVEKEKRWIEIGSGLGLVSIVAATLGHDVTMTEYNPHALNFSRANALLNQCPDLIVAELDWNNPQLGGTFDYILGSEVVYHEKNFQPLLNLLNKYLKPDGEIYFCEGIRKTSMEFFNQMQAHFQIEARKKTLRSTSEEIPVILARMTPRI